MLIAAVHSAERIAVAEGWNKKYLLMTSSFAQLFHFRSKLLEEITQSGLAHRRLRFSRLALTFGLHPSVDFDLIRPGLDQEILKISERQKRRNAEKILYQRRVEVKEHLHRLKSDGTSEALPNLTTFRKLPAIKLVQNHTSAKKASIELKSPLIAEILRNELGRWRESARETLAAILGQPNWKCPSNKKLHPVERLTAKFKCKRCPTIPRKYSKDGMCSTTIRSGPSFR